MSVTDKPATATTQPTTRPGPHWLRWCCVVAVVLLIAYGVWCGVMFATQEKYIFPGADRPPLPAAGPLDAFVEQVWLTMPDGVHVEGWFQLGEGRTPESPGPAVMYFHGNGDLIDKRWNNSRAYLAAGISFLIVEYRGYGRVGGSPSQEAIIADAVRFHDWLAARPEVDEQRIIYQGLSIGGGVAVGLAAQRKPAALILEATFTSVGVLVSRYLLPSFLCKHPFQNDEVIATLDVPILIIHGRRDRMIPVEHGRRLHQLAPNSVLVELDCGHNDYRGDPEAIAAFLRDNGLVPPD